MKAGARFRVMRLSAMIGRQGPRRVSCAYFAYTVEDALDVARRRLQHDPESRDGAYWVVRFDAPAHQPRRRA